MGFDYLKGKSWWDVTREERFFCQHLFTLIKSAGPGKFVEFLRDDFNFGVPGTGEWEVGFEVCFYRDLWQHRGREGRLYSPKRTFDLCLFGEQAIIIIEAKAAEGFNSEQAASFKQDITEVARLTNVENVQLVGLCSSLCDLEPELAAIFTGPILRWKHLAARYGDDEVLLRADSVYEKKEPFSGAGRHSDARLTGAALLDAYRSGLSWWVGRGGGLRGGRFKEDIESGKWRKQQYEVCTQATQEPSPNYFSLREFAEAVKENDTSGGKASPC